MASPGIKASSEDMSPASPPAKRISPGKSAGRVKNFCGTGTGTGSGLLDRRPAALATAGSRAAKAGRPGSHGRKGDPEWRQAASMSLRMTLRLPSPFTTVLFLQEELQIARSQFPRSRCHHDRHITAVLRQNPVGGRPDGIAPAGGA
jgi:hypothetical protein